MLRASACATSCLAVANRARPLGRSSVALEACGMSDARKPPQPGLVPQATATNEVTPSRSKRDIAFRVRGLVMGVLGVGGLASAAGSLVVLGLVAMTCSK